MIKLLKMNKINKINKIVLVRNLLNCGKILLKLFIKGKVNESIRIIS